MSSFLVLVTLVFMIFGIFYCWLYAKAVPPSHLVVGGLATILLGPFGLAGLMADIYFARKRQIGRTS